MYHESNVHAATRTSPVLSPAPSSATLSTQQWLPAAVPTESVQIANGPDRGEVPQSRKRLLTSTELQIRVGLCPALPLASRSDTLTPNQDGRPQKAPSSKPKRIKQPHSVEEVQTDAIPNVTPTRYDAKGTDVKTSPEPQGVSWPRPRMQVGWEREGNCRGAAAPARQTLRMYLLPEVAPTHVQVYLSNQTGVVGVLRADQTESGCYVADLTTVAERLGLPSLPIAARVRSPTGQLLCMALLRLEPGTAQSQCSLICFLRPSPYTQEHLRRMGHEADGQGPVPDARG